MTIVTALYDIGRADWLHWSRSFDLYLKYFESVLNLDVSMAIFVGDSLSKFVKEKRKGKEKKTKIYNRDFTELELYKHKFCIQDILAKAKFREDKEMLNNPDGNDSDYIIVTNSKPYFVKNVSDKNPFNTTHFFWMDAGYGHAIDGHGEVDFPGDHKWNPCKLLEIKRKITILKMWDLLRFEQYLYPNALHKRNILPPFAGGFFGGDAKAVNEYYEVYDKVFNSLLYDDIVDDDQSVAYHTYRELPRLFNLVDGSWCDIFKVFPN